MDWNLDPPDEYEPPQCDGCGEWMSFEEDGDEDGPYLATWCEPCDEAEGECCVCGLPSADGMDHEDCPS